MNALARGDLLKAHAITKALLAEEATPRTAEETARLLAEAVRKLCHVCAALNEDLSHHTNTQDAHNT